MQDSWKECDIWLLYLWLYVDTYVVDLVSKNTPQVSEEAIQEKMRQYGIDTFIKTSAKTGENVQQVFEQIAQRHSILVDGKEVTLRQQSGAQTVNIRRHDRQGEVVEKKGCCWVVRERWMDGWMDAHWEPTLAWNDG